jgi:flagellar motor switch protein FliN
VSPQETPAPAAAAAPAGSDAAAPAAALDLLLDVPMPVTIEIGRASLTVQEVLQLTAGSVLQLDRLVGEPVDVYVSDRRLAQGEVVVLGDHFGVRITRVLPGAGPEAAS